MHRSGKHTRDPLSHTGLQDVQPEAEVYAWRAA
jgi:hypothetical protein